MAEENQQKKNSECMQFFINNCQHSTFARFHKFSEDVSKDAGLTFASYPLGLKKLLDLVVPVGGEPENKKDDEDDEKKIHTFGG